MLYKEKSRPSCFTTADQAVDLSSDWYILGNFSKDVFEQCKLDATKFQLKSVFLLIGDLCQLFMCQPGHSIFTTSSLISIFMVCTCTLKFDCNSWIVILIRSMSNQSWNKPTYIKFLCLAKVELSHSTHDHCS